MNKFRNYQDKNIKVENTYKKMLENQNIKYVENMKNIYFKNIKKKYNIWYLINKMDDIIDESDPDSELPQIFHAYQTAESIKKRYFYNNKIKNNINIKYLFSNDEWNNLPKKYKNNFNNTITNFYKNIIDWEWLQLIGFIHDLGKIMLLDEFGSLPQWSVVGDTFPVGISLSSNFVFYDKKYYLGNKDLNNDIYKNYIGFNNVIFSWGHDEYLAHLLEENKTNLPKEAIYIIRYHSFYSWHTPRNGFRGYSKLANDYDWYMLPLLKLFQKSDLYSKNNKMLDINNIKKKYNKSIIKYLNSEYIFI
jgi:inositol oxygenase